MGRLAVAVVVALLALSGTAPANPWVDKAQEIAITKWGPPACEGPVEILMADLPKHTRAYAYWLQWDTGERTDCSVTFDTGSLVHMTWPRFCTTMVHEYGHLGPWGDHHSPDPWSVMYPFVQKGVYFPACTTPQLWYTRQVSKQPRRS